MHVGGGMTCLPWRVDRSRGQGSRKPLWGLKHRDAVVRAVCVLRLGWLVLEDRQAGDGRQGAEDGWGGCLNPSLRNCCLRGGRWNTSIVLAASVLSPCLTFRPRSGWIQSQLCPSPALWQWVGYSISLSFSFPIWKNGSRNTCLTWQL